MFDECAQVKGRGKSRGFGEDVEGREEREIGGGGAGTRERTLVDRSYDSGEMKRGVQGK